INIPEIKAITGSQRNDTQTYVLGACHPACTHVIGAVRFSGVGSWGVAYGRWITYMGGTIVWYMSAPFAGQGGSGIAGGPDICSLYDFYVQGGQVRMRRRTVMRRAIGNESIVLRAHTIQHKLKAGCFT